MSSFISKTDYKGWIDADLIDQITGGDDTNLDGPEEIAAQMIRDKTYGKYDIDAEFAKTGTNRNRTLIRWMLSIAVYFIYHDISDDDIPARVIKDYDDCVAELEKIASGKGSVDFERLTNTEGVSVTTFQYGCDQVRSHNPF